MWNPVWPGILDTPIDPGRLLRCAIEPKGGMSRADGCGAEFAAANVRSPAAHFRRLPQERFSKETWMPVPLSLRVNGKAVSADVDPSLSLVNLLREELGLTGTHVGCDTAQCGACTVHVNGRAVKSCNVLAVQVAGAEVTTIEGITPAEGMHPMQAAFKACHGLQCGFCTPGMVMSAIDLVQHHPHATEREIREGLEGNLCRCTGYQNIVKAVAQGAAAMK
jgi:carbon-monoxide dehydrogenase small subunit